MTWSQSEHRQLTVRASGTADWGRSCRSLRRPRNSELMDLHEWSSCCMLCSNIFLWLDSLVQCFLFIFLLVSVYEEGWWVLLCFFPAWSAERTFPPVYLTPWGPLKCFSHILSTGFQTRPVFLVFVSKDFRQEVRSQLKLHINLFSSHYVCDLYHDAPEHKVTILYLLTSICFSFCLNFSHLLPTFQQSPISQSYVLV